MQGSCRGPRLIISFINFNPWLRQRDLINGGSARAGSFARAWCRTNWLFRGSKLLIHGQKAHSASKPWQFHYQILKLFGLTLNLCLFFVHRSVKTGKVAPAGQRLQPPAHPPEPNAVHAAEPPPRGRPHGHSFTGGHSAALEPRSLQGRRLHHQEPTHWNPRHRSHRQVIHSLDTIFVLYIYLLCYFFCVRYNFQFTASTLDYFFVRDLIRVDGTISLRKVLSKKGSLGENIEIKSFNPTTHHNHEISRLWKPFIIINASSRGLHRWLL